MRTLTRYFLMFLAVVLVAGGAGCTKGVKVARHLNRGEKDFQAERYDRAEIAYLNVLKLAPLKPAAVSRLGMIYQAQGKFPQAFVYLRKAVELEPENNEARLKLGLTCMVLHRVKEARQAALQVLQKQPANEEALVLLADSAVTTNEVRETWQRVEALPPPVKSTAAYHLARGTLYGRQQDLDKAEAEFKQALAQDPKSSVAYSALGTLYLMRNDLKQAEPALKAAAELAPLRSTKRLRYADLKLKTGAADEAKKAVEDLTRKAPDYIPAWMFLAQTAFAEGKTNDCTPFLNRVLARDPANYDALMLGGKLSLMSGAATNAITQFQRIAALYGPGPQVQYQLALAHLLNRDSTKAIASLNQAIAASTNFAEAVLLLAQLNLRKGNPAAAIASLAQLIKQQPQLPQAHLGLANAYLANRNPDQAVAVLRRMAGLFPKAPDVPFLMGVVLNQQNKKTEAREAFEKTLAISQDYLPALEQVVDLDLLDKQYPAAVQRVRKQMERSPAAGEPWLLLAKIHLAQSAGYLAKELEKNPGAAQANLKLAQVPAAQPDMNQAEAALRKAIELNPNLRVAYLMLAQLYVASNKQQQALNELNGFLTKTNDVVALMLVGMIHDESKNYPAARDTYEKLLQINPRFNPALNNLAYLYSARFGQLDKGYQLAERARQLQPSDPFVADTLGWILFQKGEYTRSLGLFQESAAKLPADPEIQFHLGMAHYMMGEEDPARLALQQVVRANKDFPEKAEAPRRLAMLAINVNTADAAVLAELEQSLQKTPNDPIALSRLGAIQERNGAFNKAVQTYQTALKLNPENAQLMLRLAQLYSERLNDAPRALELLKEAHTRAPEDARISHLLGRLVFQQGDHKWASSLLEESIRKLPNDPEVLFDLAWSRYSLGRVAEAETAMTAAAKAGAAFTRAAEAKRFLDLLIASKDPALAERAVAEVQKILITAPDYVPALMVSALVQEQHRGYQEAGRLYDRILARYPLFAPAGRNLAILCAEQLGEDLKAYPLAAKAREAFPQDADLAKTLGALAYRRGDYARSAQLLKETALKRNNDAELFYYLGMAHYHLKESKEGKAALQRALSLNLKPQLADETRRVLAQLK